MEIPMSRSRLTKFRLTSQFEELRWVRLMLKNSDASPVLIIQFGLYNVTSGEVFFS